ncbi:MAG TPA: ATP-binding cassette domain-containing protein [Chitinophagaceae bacterium]
MDVIEISDIKLRFGARYVLSDIYVTCKTGAPTGLIGRNGQGKSTLMKVIFGSLPAESACIRINNKTLDRSLLKEQQVSYLPQFNFFPKKITIKEAFADFRLSFDDFISWFPDLNRTYSTRFNTLSGGEKRIVEIYAICKSASLLKLLDEPFTYLSPIQAEVVSNLILAESTKKIFLITDHLYEHVLQICNEVYFLKEGSVKKIHTVEELEFLGYTRSDR